MKHSKVVDEIELIYVERSKKYLILSDLMICQGTNQKICEGRKLIDRN